MTIILIKGDNCLLAQLIHAFQDAYKKLYQSVKKLLQLPYSNIRNSYKNVINMECNL